MPPTPTSRSSFHLPLRSCPTRCAARSVFELAAAEAMALAYRQSRLFECEIAVSIDAPKSAHAERVARHQSPDLFGELIQREGLRQKAVGSRLFGISAVGRRCALAHHQHRHIAQPRRAADELANLVARVARKEQIDADEVGLATLE